MDMKMKDCFTNFSFSRSLMLECLEKICRSTLSIRAMKLKRTYLNQSLNWLAVRERERQTTIGFLLPHRWWHCMPTWSLCFFFSSSSVSGYFCSLTGRVTIRIVQSTRNRKESKSTMSTDEKTRSGDPSPSTRNRKKWSQRSCTTAIYIKRRDNSFCLSFFPSLATRAAIAQSSEDKTTEPYLPSIDSNITITHHRYSFTRLLW